MLDALADMVERSGLKIGDRLPPEVSLAAHARRRAAPLSCEALNRWEGLGIIRRRRGDGDHLSARVQTSRGLACPLWCALEGEALLRLLEIRRTLENDVVRKATIKATREQRREISRLCDVLLVEVHAGRPWRKADHAFHGAIYDAPGNLDARPVARQSRPCPRTRRHSPFSADVFGLDSSSFHCDPADAILAESLDGAVDAIGRIIDVVEREVQAIIDGDKPS